MTSAYTIGLDYGTNSVRAVMIDVKDGSQLCDAVHAYRRGEDGVFYSRSDAHVARQHPYDYLEGIESCVSQLLASAAGSSGFSPMQVIGIGVDTTGSSPLPVDVHGQALALSVEFKDDLDAYVWLWKDHTAYAEAAEITASAQLHHPEYLTKCGGKYSSEWYWAKLLRLARVSPRVAEATASWVEIADWIPAVLSGVTEVGSLRRGICAAGHKAFFNYEWDGYPSTEWLHGLHPVLGRIGRALPDQTYDISQQAGRLSSGWAARLGLREGIAIAIGGFDAHLGAVGAGIRDEVLVKVIGTSTCDIMVAPIRGTPDVPGLCGIVPGSVLPGLLGLEAGQSAVGDIYNWFVNEIGGAGEGFSHSSLTLGAEALKPAESGLLTLDWHNGNRTVLVDQRLTGLVVGMSLHTTREEIYRSLLEASAFGARVIVERLEAYGIRVSSVINCGGISARNPLAMQIYADVLQRPISVSASTQTCALGSAIAAAVAAGSDAGGYRDFPPAMAAMADKGGRVFVPDQDSAVTYDALFALYRDLHDSFGVVGTRNDLSTTMKTLMSLRDECLTTRDSRAA